MTVVLPHQQALGELDAQLEALAAEGRKHQRRRDALAQILDTATLGADPAKLAASREELRLLDAALDENAQRRALLGMERREVRTQAGGEASRIQEAQRLLDSLPDLFNSPQRHQPGGLLANVDELTAFAQRVDRARALLKSYGYEVAERVTLEI